MALLLGLLLGLLSAIGPFASDMYLPARQLLQAIGERVGAVQFLCASLAQMFEAKTLLYAGLALFALCRIGCALAISVRCRRSIGTFMMALTQGGGHPALSMERAS